MHKAKPISTPMVSSLKLTKEGTDMMCNPFLYRSIVGALQYATIIRPEISFYVSKVSQFMQNSLEEHWKAVKRIFFPALVISISLVIVMQIQGMLLMTGGLCPGFACSQAAISYYGVQRNKLQLLGPQRKQNIKVWLLLSCPSSKPIIFCDNMSTILLSKNPLFHNRTKHLELDLHFVKEKVTSGLLTVAHVPSLHQVVDVFTKPLSYSRFDFILSSIC